MKVVILAGGFGKRLKKDLVSDLMNVPKPLMPIRGSVVIEYLMKLITPLKNMDLVYILTIKKFETDFKKWCQSFSFEKEIKFTIEPITEEVQDPGAIGALGFFIGKEKIDDDLLVIAGDNMFSGFNLADFIQFAKEKKAPVIVCYDLENKEKLKEKFGEITLNEDKKIIRFREKPKQPRTSLASTACYLFPRSTLNLIFDYLVDKKNPTDAPGYFIKWLTQQMPTYGFVFKGRWFDIGRLEDYERADQFFSKKFKKNTKILSKIGLKQAK